MPSDSSVIADPANGVAIVAGTRLAMSADANGALRFGGPDGRVLRPLTFGERTELVSAASALPAARDAVAAAILAAATIERIDESGGAPQKLMEVLAMWLAGAAFDAPDFMETTLLVARGAGWPPHELFAAPAREVDRLAMHLDEQRRASEWKSIVFAEPPAETIEAVRMRFADRLLRRSVAAAVVVEGAQLLPVLREEKVLRFAQDDTGRAVTLSREDDEGPPSVRQARAEDRGVTLSREDDEGSSSVRQARAEDRGVTLSGEDDEGSSSVRQARAEDRGVTLSGEDDEGSSSVRQARAEDRGVALSGEDDEGPSQRTALSFSIRQARLGGGSFARREESEMTHFAELARTSTPPHANATSAGMHGEDLAATLASLLDDEADLRGVER